MWDLFVLRLRLAPPALLSERSVRDRPLYEMISWTRPTVSFRAGASSPRQPLASARHVVPLHGVLDEFISLSVQQRAADVALKELHQSLLIDWLSLDKPSNKKDGTNRPT